MIVFIGDSHLRALAHGYMRLASEEREAIESKKGGLRFAMLGPAFSFAEPFFTRDEQGLRFQNQMEQRLSQALGPHEAVIRPGDRREFVVSIGMQPSYIHQPKILERWTTGSPEGGAAHVSRAAFRLGVLEYNRHALDFFKALSEMGVKASALAAPPPALSFGLIRKFGDRALSLWLAHDAILSAELERLGVSVERAPAIVREGDKSDGMLRAPLRDVYAVGSPHGNDWYGELFLRDLFGRRGVRRVKLSAKALEFERAKLEAPETLAAWTRRLGFSLANRREDATEQFLTAVQEDPEERRGLYGLAYALERLGRWLDAEAKYRDLLELHPFWDIGWMALARVLFVRGKHEEALQALERAGELGCVDRERLLRLGAVHEKLKRPQEARTCLRAALFDEEGGLDPAWTAAPKEPTEEGFHPLKVSAEPDPTEAALSPPLTPASFLVVLGRVELALGQVAEAERCFQMAMRLDATHPEWNAYLGDIDLRRKHWASAATRYAIVLQYSPKVAAYAKRLGMAYERQKKIKHAREVYLVGVREHPADVEFVDALRRVTIPA